MSRSVGSRPNSSGQPGHMCEIGRRVGGKGPRVCLQYPRQAPAYGNLDCPNQERLVLWITASPTSTILHTCHRSPDTRPDRYHVWSERCVQPLESEHTSPLTWRLRAALSQSADSDGHACRRTFFPHDEALVYGYPM